MAQTNNVGIIIFTFMCLIVGIPLLMAISDQVSLVDKTYDVENESITLSNSTAAELDNNWVTKINYLYVNQSGVYSPLTENTNFIVTGKETDAGVSILLKPTQGIYNGNTSLVSYTYEDDNYIRGSVASQVIIKLVVIFFTLGILALGVFLVIRSGILNQ